MNVLIGHIPHAVPVVVIWGIMLRFWLQQRRLPPLEDRAPTAEPAIPSAAVALPAAPVGRTVAMRGLLALGPVLGALGTGLVIYALNLGRGHAGATAVWTHVGISLLALLLVGYKLAEVGLARLRASFTGRRALRSGGSLVLLALWVPLLASGVALLFFPSEASFTAYAHLIASVWWTGLLLWHLRRYLARATRTVLARPQAGAGAPRSPRQPRQPRSPRQGSIGRPAVVARDEARAGARRIPGRAAAGAEESPPASRFSPGRAAAGAEESPPASRFPPGAGRPAAGVTAEDEATAPVP